MARRALGLWIASGLSIVALAGCPDSKPVAPPPGPAPAASPPPKAVAPAPAESALPLDPMYDPLRVGETYVVKMDYGTPLTSRAEIKAKDADTVTIVTRTELGSQKAEPNEQKYPRRRQPLDLKLAAAPSDEKVLRKETLTVSGIEFPCTVSESVDAVAGRLQSWKCESRYPGLVKQVDASGKVVYELVEVQAPKSP